MNSNIIKDLVAKLNKDKKTAFILVVAIVGILLIMLSGSDNQESKSNKSAEEIEILSEIELAESLEKLIESIDGAGKTRVMITFGNYCETVYAENTDENVSTDGERDKSDEYIIIEDDKGETGLKLKVLSPEIKGVAVICQGGSNPVIKEQIISTVSALFDISSNNISVAVMAK